MAVKPILFNTKMVQAILEGRKTQTRRVIKQFVPGDAQFGYTAFTPGGNIFCRGNFADGYGEKFYKLPYLPGDVLWVRETWAEMPYGYVYRADGEPVGWDAYDRWNPSIHMPKEAARIFLRVTGVRVERLQEISRDSAISEGCNAAIPVLEFKAIWDTTIKPADRDKYGWDASPWVWVIRFERCEKPENRGDPPSAA